MRAPRGRRHIRRALSYLVFSRVGLVWPNAAGAVPRNWLLTLIVLSDPFKRAFTKRRRTRQFSTLQARDLSGLLAILEKLNPPEAEFTFSHRLEFLIPAAAEFRRSREPENKRILRLSIRASLVRRGWCWSAAEQSLYVTGRS